MTLSKMINIFRLKDSALFVVEKKKRKKRVTQAEQSFLSFRGLSIERNVDADHRNDDIEDGDKEDAGRNDIVQDIRNPMILLFVYVDPTYDEEHHTNHHLRNPIQ